MHSSCLLFAKAMIFACVGIRFMPVLRLHYDEAEDDDVDVVIIIVMIWCSCAQKRNNKGFREKYIRPLHTTYLFYPCVCFRLFFHLENADKMARF